MLSCTICRDHVRILDFDKLQEAGNEHAPSCVCHPDYTALSNWTKEKLVEALRDAADLVAKTRETTMVDVAIAADQAVTDGTYTTTEQRIIIGFMQQVTGQKV